MVAPGNIQRTAKSWRRPGANFSPSYELLINNSSESEATAERKGKTKLKPPQLGEVSDAAKRSIEAAVRAKSLSKACKTLQSSHLAPIEDVERKLRELHPDGPDRIPLDVCTSGHRFTFTPDDVWADIASFDTCSGPGPSGPVHLFEMARSKHKAVILEALAESASAFCSGSFSAEVMTLLTAARLVGLPKPGGVRPIAMGDTLR